MLFPGVFGLTVTMEFNIGVVPTVLAVGNVSGGSI